MNINTLEKVIDNHLTTGIPLDSYNITPDQMLRLRAAVALYHYWRKDPFVEPERWLRVVKHREPRQIGLDKQLFEFIQRRKQEQIISVADAQMIADHGIRRMFKAAEQTGDTHTLDVAMKHLAKWHDPNAAEPTEDEHSASLPVVFTSKIKDIAPDYEEVAKRKQLAILAKYGGKPDENEELVDKKMAKIKENKE